ncbi:LysR family transcriptional regulator [Pseudomaricurvus alkylphenolicus]|jgi:DNA-binding transcriptional LysR family regulator|uniref:LysR family transcriptional regulator n=1 Tax=Pseudomaricurvus alkylphenolicus TaxID=1306991 RepID=UPI0014215F94|nr:LysR family transcriptional regulator [Pseudomaricurvus alkylphenolicus]NIB41123.1 LysR family transcriptional regulator [Pseudomaricurvus alkylphenolicus]
MNIARIDLNLLVYLDVLLRERNVTKAANQLGISQPAMSNGLKRLRDLFDDPLLIRTSEGMTPTERAQELKPQIRSILVDLEKTVQPRSEFKAYESSRVFRIMASDYAECTLIPALLGRLRNLAPNITLDIMTPSDVSFLDVEQGRVDMVINRFDDMPQSFHQKTLWKDHFSCILSKDNPVLGKFNLDSYLESQHVWVSKTGMGVGVGVNPSDVQRLGWVDESLKKMGKKRHITVFTRHYQAAALLAEQKDLIATVPSKLARLQLSNNRVSIMPPPFDIPPFELKMAWSPLLQNNPEHQWMRNLLSETAETLDNV